MRILLIVWVAVGLFASCKQNDEVVPSCNRPMFSPKKETAYTLENEVMVLKRVTNPDTSFLYLQWDNDQEERILFIFDPASTFFTNAESLVHYQVTAEVKVSCASDPTINGVPTMVMNVLEATPITNCPIEVTQTKSRSLEMTYWRFLGFRSGNDLEAPTCEDNFLYLVFTTAQVNPVNPDNRYFAEIYNGVNVCDYFYEFSSSDRAVIGVAVCYRDVLGGTKASRSYGKKFMQALLDPDGFGVDHQESHLIIKSDNMDEELIFIGL